MKKAFFLTVLGLLMTTWALAQIPKMEVFELGALSDVVVTGKIKLLDSKNYTLEIDQVVAGAYEGKTIVVEKFHNTKTAKRWGKYVVGESMMLWLKKDGEAYKIVGINGEGEKMLFGTEVYLDSRGGGLKNTFGNHAPYPGSAIYAEKVNAEEFIAAVRDTKDLFAVDIEEKKSPEGEVSQKRFSKTEAEGKVLDDVRSRSWMHDNIIANAEKHAR